MRFSKERRMVKVNGYGNIEPWEPEPEYVREFRLFRAWVEETI